MFLALQLIVTLQPGAGPALPEWSFLPLEPLPLSTPIIAVAIAGMLLAAAVARYLSRSIAIGAEKEIAFQLGRHIVDGLAGFGSAHGRMEVARQVDEPDLMKAISSGTRFCGMAVRLTLSNAINVFYLIAGVIVFLSAASELWPVLLGAIAVVLILAYPLNMKTVRLGHRFEEIGKHRGRVLRSRVRTARGAPPTDFDDGLGELDPDELETRYLGVLGDRLRILDLSHLVYSAFFALLIGALLWLLAEGPTDDLISHGQLLLLFFALRFTFTGLRGVMVLNTAVNRHMLAILRVYRIVRLMDRLRSEERTADQAAVWDQSRPRPIRFPWRVEQEGGDGSSGTLETGQLNVLALASAGPDGILYHLSGLISKGRALAVRLVERDLDPNDRDAEEDEERRQEKHANRPAAAWIGAIAQYGGVEIGDGEIDGALAGQCDGPTSTHEIVLALARLHERVARGNPLLLVTDPEIHKLPSDWAMGLRQQLGDRLVFYVVGWQQMDAAASIADRLFVAAGDGCGYVAAIPSMTDADWAAARAIYDTAAMEGLTFSLNVTAAHSRRGMPTGETETPITLGAPLVWRIEPELVEARDGTLRPGETAVIALPPESEIPVAAQVATMVAGAGDEVAKRFVAGLVQPYARSGEFNAQPPAGMTNDAWARAAWVGPIMRECEIPASDEDCAAIFAGARDDGHLWPAVIRQLGVIHDHLRSENPFVVLDKRLLLHLSPQRQKVIYSRLNDRLVFYVLPWIDLFDRRLVVDWFFVSTGRRLAYARRVDEMGRAEWGLARQGYNLDRRTPRMADDHLDLLEEELL
jgi:hypothetical protein